MNGESSNGKLTSKQALFVEAYLECWNATEAARRAGYQGNDIVLASVGYKLVRKGQISQRIKERIQAACMSTDEALGILAQQARFDPGDYLKLDGEYPCVDLALLKKAGLTSIIKSITPTRYGARVEFYDTQAALEKILRAGGVYKDNLDVTSGGEAITFVVKRRDDAD